MEAMTTQLENVTLWGQREKVVVPGDGRALALWCCVHIPLYEVCREFEDFSNDLVYINTTCPY